MLFFATGKFFTYGQKIAKYAYDPEELCHATKMSLKSSGNIDASKVVEHVCLTNTEDESRVRKLCANLDTNVVSAKLTMDQYNLLRDSAKQIGFNL
jgi:hypothetical protein